MSDSGISPIADRIFCMDLKEKIRTSLAGRKRVALEPGPVTAAVLIPIIPRNGDYHILFTKRSENLNHHGGEISFPGGVSQPEDSDTLMTALRETWEEVGIPPDEVDVLGALDDFLSIHNYLVTPYVGVVSPERRFVANPSEIERLIEVPFSFLLTPGIFQLREWTWQGRTFPLFFITYGSDTIWGLTAAMLKQFLELVPTE
jgi:8-oxo-dGTP pyrophosphatase MutT (NUDIX family)